MSEETMRKVDAEIRGIIDRQYALARKLIEENRDKVEAMAKALLEFETIDSDQLGDIMAGKPPRPPKPTQTSSATPSSGTPPQAGTAPSANPALALLAVSHGRGQTGV
jgi:cell division protease FtsH